MKKLAIKVLALTALFVVACKNAKSTEESTGSKTSIYHGGDIITMEGDTPEYVEAVAVEDGKIAFVGSLAEAEEQFAGSQKHDLQGKTLVPGFIDSHSHFMQTALKLNFVNLDPPPAGNTKSIEDIKTALAEELKNRPERYQDETDWLIGWGFDNAFLQEARFPTREDLDQVTTEFPIALIHFSSHMLAMNTKGMERAGYFEDDFKIPEGGFLQYFDNGEPSGVVEEQAMLPAMSRIGEDFSGNPGLYISIPLPKEEMKAALLKSQEVYASAGFTTVAEMGAGDSDYEVVSELGEANELKLDFAMGYYSKTTTVENVAARYSPDYKNHYRVMGGKLNLDGGTPGRTAFLREPYHTPTPGQPADYRGYSSIKEQKDMNELIGSYYAQKVPFFIHALGDAAVDQCIAAVKYAEENFPYENSRTQIIHAQQVQPDQFESLKELDVTITFQIAHNFYFADFHNEFILGPERTARLNPAKEAIDNGFSVTIHHDSPVHPVDQMHLMWTAVNRSSRSGTVYGPDQRLSPYEALRASTIEAAYQYKEEDAKGSLTVGKLADMVVLDENPLKVDPDTIKDINVVETIKEGEMVFKKN